jgi:tyrosinase
MAGSMVYRLPVGDGTLPYMRSFRAAIRAAQAISDNRGYNYIAGFHGAPGNYCWHHQFNPRTPLQARLFLPWHRAYLWWLEQALQDRVAGVALPWWDWTRVRAIPAAYRARRENGQVNPLSGSRIFVPSASPPLNRRTRRAPGATPGVALPTQQEIDDLLDDTDWASFSDRLESYHDEVHVWVGGDMQDITTAAFDPVFFAHHCMIDRIWYLWQVRYGDGGIPGELLSLPLQPFGKTFAGVLSTQALGYEYATSATQLPADGRALASGDGDG